MTARVGVFTPWAEALCLTCHETRSAHGTYRTIDAAALEAARVARPRDFWPGFCTACGTSTDFERDDVALLTRVRRILAAGPDPLAFELEQTGGMCVALSHDVDGRRVFVTYGMSEPECFELGVYEIVDAEEGIMSDEALSYEELHSGGDDALAAAVRAAAASAKVRS